MNKEKEEKIKEKLTSLSKEDVELYFQKCYDYEVLWDDLVKENQKLKQQLEEKEKDICWYSMWHKKFQKQIEDLTTELETYRPTKLHGNGQCECFKCKQEGRQAREWTDWCSRYKGHTYCDDCLKEVLKEEQAPQTQLAIQELEKVEDSVFNYVFQQIKELSGGKNGKF